MNVTTHRAFGYLTQRTVFQDGEVHTVSLPANRQWYNYCTKGSFLTIYNHPLAKHLEPPMLTGDWNGPDVFATFSGKTEHTATGETVIWCVGSELNNNYLPDCEKWFLANGQSQTLPVGTKLFFAQGNLTINGANINTPTQVRVKTTDTTVTANEDCYGILFL